MSTAPFRRIVTGHNAKGQAIIQEEGSPPRVRRIGGEHGPIFYEVWNTRETPARIDAASGEPPEDGISLAPPKNGTRIRVLDIPPEDGSLDNISEEEARAHFAEVGAAGASSHSSAGSRHAYMHRTETIDYGIVLAGTVELELDDGAVTSASAGDIIIQRGTIHLWRNPSTDTVCRIAFVLIEAAPVVVNGAALPDVEP